MFRGSFVALITPMALDGEIAWRAFEELIEWHIAEGTDGLVIAGSTGEEPTLSHSEKLALFKRAVEVANGRIPLVAGTGTNSTRDSLECTQEAKKLGFDGALVVVPYYNRPNEHGCYAHFATVAKAGLPMIMYHHPVRTGVRLTADAIARICEIPELAAVKETSGDIALAIDLVNRLDKPILSGDDGISLAQLAVGFSGVISVIGNLIPRQWGDFVRQPTREKFSEFYDLFSALGLEINPQCVKYAMSVLGKCEPMIRLPLLMPQETTKRRLEAALKECLEPTSA